MTEVFSIAFGAILLIGLLFFVGTFVFELVSRLRDRMFSPEAQLRRADLGHYPHWQN